MTTGIELKTTEQDSKKNTDHVVRPEGPENETANDLNIYDSGNRVCELCALNKQTRVIHHDGIGPTTTELKRVHTDLWGPYNPASFGGNSYGAVLVDDFTRRS